MVEKVSQADSNNSGLPNVPAVAPTSDTAYIQPVIGKLGYDTKHPEIFGLGSSPDNGASFHVWASFGGIVLDKDNMDAIWINGVSDRVKKEVDAATAEIPGAIASANEAVKRADSAVANSKVNSDAIKAIQSAASEAKSDAQNATNIANAMKSSVTDQLKNLDRTSKELDNARSEMTQYAKTAQDQGKDIADLKKSTAEITADVANTKGDVAELKINASATAVMASNNKSDITQLQVTASNASIDLQNAKSDIASFNATANKINTSIKDQDNRISTVEQTAKGIQATIGNQQNDINTIKQDATGMKETITNNQKQLTEINTSVDGLSTKVAGAVGKDFVEYSIKQANDKINESITSINGNIQNITADLNGVQATVKNKADISQVTQLSNAIASKVSQDDYNTEISQLSNDINLRVSKGDLISQINLAAGQTLIQSDKIYLDAGTVAFSGKAFIPSAAIASLEADKITTGTLNGVHIHQIANANGRSIDIANGNISLNSSDPYEPRITFNYQGKGTKMFNAVGDLEADNFSIFNFAPSDTSSLHPITYFSIANTGGSGSGNASMHLDHAIIDGHEWWASADGITFGRSYDGQNTSSTYVDLYAKSFDPHSQLSSKTRIERLDGREALATIMNDEMYTYQYKSDVASGSTKRYASLIIDDVNDVKQYRSPKIFIADNGKCRDDGTQLAYLIAAFQYQHQVINELTDKVNQLEEKING